MRAVPWRPALGLVGLTLVAAVLRFWALRFGLPQPLTRPDEEAITTVAAQIVLRSPNPHFFDYPTLFMYLVAFVERMWPGGAVNTVNDATLPLLISRSLAATFGTLSVPLLLFSARRLFPARAAWVSAALLAVAFLHVRDSHFGVTDVPMTFMVLLAFWAIVSLPMDRGQWWNVAIAAVLCGLAASTKYNAVLVAAPLAVVMVQARTARWMYVVAAAGLVAGFLAATPYALIAREKFVADVIGLQSHLASGHGVDEGRGWTHYLGFSLRYGAGLPCLLAALAGGVWLAVTDRRRACLVLAFPLLYYGVMGSGRTVFMRHMTPMIPFVALLAAVAIDAATLRVSRLLPAVRGLSSAIAIVLTIAVGYDSAARAIALDRLLSERDSRAIAAEFVHARYFPRRTSVYQTGDFYGRVQLWPEGIYPETPLDRLPQLVIVQSSRLVAYSGQPSGLRETLTRSYQLLLRVDVEKPDGPEPVFDQQDAFFTPVAGFERFVRPGPALEIYERLP